MTDQASTGIQESLSFGHLEIRFDGRVLRPRPWTAAQSEWAAELMETGPPGPALELCAGAGQIGLLMVAGTTRHLVCVDLDPVACDYTLCNAREAGLADRVTVREGPLDRVLSSEERFALVAADPPWVPHRETGRHPEDPLLAIDGGDDGLDVARQCVAVASRHLLAGGSMILQLGSPRQAATLGAELPTYVDLELTEIRTYPRGVLVRLPAVRGVAVPGAACECRRTTARWPTCRIDRSPSPGDWSGG